MKLIFEQIARISITGVVMINIILLEINKLAEMLSIISLLIWMLLPSWEIYKQEKERINNKNMEEERE